MPPMAWQALTSGAGAHSLQKAAREFGIDLSHQLSKDGENEDFQIEGQEGTAHRMSIVVIEAFCEEKIAQIAEGIQRATETPDAICGSSDSLSVLISAVNSILASLNIMRGFEIKENVLHVFKAITASTKLANHSLLSIHQTPNHDNELRRALQKDKEVLLKIHDLCKEMAVHIIGTIDNDSDTIIDWLSKEAETCIDVSLDCSCYLLKASIEYAIRKHQDFKGCVTTLKSALENTLAIIDAVRDSHLGIQWNTQTQERLTEIVRTLRRDALRLMSVNSAKNDFMSGLKIIVLCLQKIRKISHEQIDLAIESLSEIVELYADLEIVYVSHTSHELSATDDFRERIKHLCDGALPFVGKILSISISEKLDSVPQARRIAMLDAFSAISKGKIVQRFHVFFMVIQKIYKMSQPIHSETLLDVFYTFIKILTSPNYIEYVNDQGSVEAQKDMLHFVRYLISTDIAEEVLIALYNLFTDSSSFVRSLSSLLWRSILYRANISTVANIIGCMINLLKPVADAYYNSYGQCPPNVTSLANDMGSTISRLLQDSLEESSHIFENILEESRDARGQMQFASLGILLSNGLFEFEDGAQIQGTSSIIAISIQLFKSAVCQISKSLEEMRLEVGLDDTVQADNVNIARSFGELWSASDFVASFLRSDFLKSHVPSECPLELASIVEQVYDLPSALQVIVMPITLHLATAVAEAASLSQVESLFKELMYSIITSDARIESWSPLMRKAFSSALPELIHGKGFPATKDLLVKTVSKLLDGILNDQRSWATKIGDISAFKMLLQLKAFDVGLTAGLPFKDSKPALIQWIRISKDMSAMSEADLISATYWDGISNAPILSSAQNMTIDQV